jgi:hypothetical protein
MPGFMYRVFRWKRLRISFGTLDYGDLRVLKEGGGLQVTKETVNEQVRYRLRSHRGIEATIRGEYRPSNFHILRAENSSGDKVSGFRTLPVLLAAIEEDLREQSIRRMTTTCVNKLAAIAVKRYGFVDSQGRGYKQLQNAPHSRSSYLCASLVKYL